MVVFAIRTKERPEVAAYLCGVDEKLQRTDYILSPLRGRVRGLHFGLYVVDVEPVYPRFLVNAMMLFTMGGAFISYLLGFTTLAAVVFCGSLLVALLWNALFSAAFYQAVIMLQLRRATKEWVLVRRADSVVLRKVAYGKV